MSIADPRQTSGRRRLISSAAAVAALALGVAACGESQTPPVYAAVDGYLTSLAQGNYTAACTYLDGKGRDSLKKATGSHVSCAKVFDRCLPDQARVAKKDDTQFNYATVDITTHGTRGSASVTGTAVARVVRRVGLVKDGPRWKLTSYGEGLKGCRSKASRHRRTGPRARPSPGA